MAATRTENEEHRPFDERLPLDIGGVDFAEHDKKSYAKKIVKAAYVYPDQDPTDPAEHHEIERVVLAVAGATTLERGKAYRIISSAAFRYVLHMDTVTPAVAEGKYVPADTEIIIFTRGYNTITVAGSGFVDAHELA